MGHAHALAVTDGADVWHSQGECEPVARAGSSPLSWQLEQWPGRPRAPSSGPRSQLQLCSLTVSPASHLLPAFLPGPGSHQEGCAFTCHPTGLLSGEPLGVIGATVPGEHPGTTPFYGPQDPGFLVLKLKAESGYQLRSRALWPQNSELVLVCFGVISSNAQDLWFCAQGSPPAGFRDHMGIEPESAAQVQGKSPPCCPVFSPALTWGHPRPPGPRSCRCLSLIFPGAPDTSHATFMH